MALCNLLFYRPFLWFIFSQQITLVPAMILVVPMEGFVLTGSGFAIRLTTVGICLMKLIVLQVSKVQLNHY